MPATVPRGHAWITTTLDVLSQGRSMLGLGAAWHEREHTAFGISYPPLPERFEMMEETLQICLQMWSDDDGPTRASTTTRSRRSAGHSRSAARPS